VGCGEVGRINKIISCLLTPDDRLLTLTTIFDFYKRSMVKLPI